MSRLFTRIFCAVLFVFSGQVWADIPMVAGPMVTGPVIRPNVLSIPHLPTHRAQEFNGVMHVSVRSGSDVNDALDVQSQVDVSAFGVPCDVDIRAEPLPDAMIELRVFAPCKPHAVVHVSHGGFSYEAQVSLTGRTRVEFPAMRRAADVFVAVDEEVFERHIEVEDVRHFARIVLAGVSDTDAKLVALSLSREMEVYQNRGVQVFSVDMRDVDAAMTYRMKLRHQVTAENCNKPVHTHLRRILPGMAADDQILRLSPRDCSRIGDILELNNVVQDLKLASN